MRVDHARLDDDVPVGNVHFENAVHARQADHDAARGRQRAAAQSRARAAADKGNLVPRADPHHRLHLLRSARQHHGVRQHAEIRQAVALVGLQLALAGDQPVVTNGCAQLVDLAGGQHSRTAYVKKPELAC